MTRFGYFLSCEEYAPGQLLDQARLAEKAGFDSLWISDHFHLWTGDVVSREGTHYTVDTARIFTLPETPPPIYMSAFGPKALKVAGRIADGFITTNPDADAVEQFCKDKGANAPTQAGFKVAWGPTRDEAIDTASEMWPNAGVPGELSQVLPSPQHFEQAAELVTREKFTENGAFGPGVAEHADAFGPFIEAGFDEVYVANMGPHYEDMLSAYGSDVLPELRSRT